LASIKPQLVVLLLGWFAIWAMADWRRRYRLAVSFLASMTILVAASEWYLPHWIPRFWRAIHEYQRYTGAMSVMDNLIGAPWSWMLELVAFGATIGVCWRERRQAANTASFAFTLSLVLAATVILIPTWAPYNQVLLFPSLLVLVKEHLTVWQRSAVNRVLMVITTVLIVWPWISATALAGLSFVLPQRAVERVWQMPAWTVIQIPVGVAFLMLTHYYQRPFGAAAGPHPS
jgi:hypothetical protein